MLTFACMQANAFSSPQVAVGDFLGDNLHLVAVQQLVAVLGPGG